MLRVGGFRPPLTGERVPSQRRPHGGDVSGHTGDPVTRRTKRLLIGALILALAVLSAVPAAAQSSTNEKPQATEIGVTASEIHIAVVADVEMRWHRLCSRARSTASRRARPT